MTRGGSDRVHGPPPLASGEHVHENGADAALDGPSAERLGATVPVTDPDGSLQGGSFILGVMFALLSLGLVVATLACLAVVGLALGVWPAAVIDAFAEGALAARAGRLAAALAAPLVIAALLHLSWGAFTKAKAARCAEWMIAALAASLGVYSFVFAEAL